MATRFLAAGFELVVWNRSTPALDTLATLGTVAAETPRRRDAPT